MSGVRPFVEMMAGSSGGGSSGPTQSWTLGEGSNMIDFTNATIQNIEESVTAQAVFVRYASYFRSLPQEGNPPHETTAQYFRVDSPYINAQANPPTREQHWAQYIEIMPSVDNTETGDAAGGGVKVMHKGRGGDAYDVILLGEGAVGYEAATFFEDNGTLNGTKGFIATLQVLNGSKCNSPNATFFTALWESEVVPNYGLLLFQQASGHAITIERFGSTNFGQSGTINEGQAMMRICTSGYGRNLWTVYNSGRMDLAAQNATVGTTVRNSPEFSLIGTYWSANATHDRAAQLVHAVASTTDSYLAVKVGDLNSEATVCVFKNYGGAVALDMQSNDIAGVDDLTFAGAGSVLDMQTGTMTNVGSITMGGNIDCQNHDITNVNSIAFFGAGNIDLQGGSVVNAINVQSSSALFDVYADGGTLMAEVAAPADGETALLVRRNVGGAYTLQRVSMGAADSGGSGYKVLRVAN